MPNKIDVLSRISPQMSAVLAQEDALAGDANDTSAGFAQMRENYVAGRAWWNEGAPKLARVVDDVVEGPSGAIAVRRYYPRLLTAGELSPAIVYVHGGGFVLGNLDTHDRICRILAERAGVPVVAVDYRLSPEARYPSAVRETAAVASFLHREGAGWGIDGDRVAFAGDSGGAHLGLAATLYLREECGGADFVRCLLLFYGWFGLTDSASMRLLGGPWDGLAEEDWQFYMGLYAEDPETLVREPYANLLANDLTRDMPACYIAAAEFDPLRDDSACLATICEQYGIPCRYEMFEGVIHAFLHYTKMLDAANDALEHAATFYRETLGL
ncbi:MAG: acetyl esterase [Adlercreutzia mucosicola]|jgi:acetyl esterase|nr:acetyl esterase [Adlercreutzia mucosicola]